MSIVSLSTTITSTADSGWLLDSEYTGDILDLLVVVVVVKKHHSTANLLVRC
jgi:hypothetical protein